MERIQLKQTGGRGRNGWFRAREAVLLATNERVDLDVMSNRPAIPGPVRLELSLADAAALAQGLLRAVTQAQPQPPSQPAEPQNGYPGPQTAAAVLEAFVRCQGGAPPATSPPGRREPKAAT